MAKLRFVLLLQLEEVLSMVGNRIQLGVEIRRALEELQEAREEVRLSASAALDSEDVRQAQQHLLTHQVLMDARPPGR